MLCLLVIFDFSVKLYQVMSRVLTFSVYGSRIQVEACLLSGVRSTAWAGATCSFFRMLKSLLMPKLWSYRVFNYHLHSKNPWNRLNFKGFLLVGHRGIEPRPTPSESATLSVELMTHMCKSGSPKDLFAAICLSLSSFNFLFRLHF